MTTTDKHLQVREADLDRTITVLLDLMNSFTWDEFYFTKEGMALLKRLGGSGCGINPHDPEVRRKFKAELGIAAVDPDVEGTARLL